MSTNFAKEFHLYENLFNRVSKNRANLTEAAGKAYTVKDFTWLSDSYYADKFKLAALAYLNGASLDDALADIRGELLSVGDVPGARKTKLGPSTEEGEYCIIYRVANWPANETAEATILADTRQEAEDTFWESMLDPENYDAGDTVLDESDITILHIYKKPV